MQVVIGNNCSLAPFSMAKAGTVLPAGASIGPQATAPADPRKKAPKAPVLAALKTHLDSPALSAEQALGFQVCLPDVLPYPYHSFTLFLFSWNMHVQDAG